MSEDRPARCWVNKTRLGYSRKCCSNNVGELSWGKCMSRHVIERRVDSVTSLLVIKMLWLLSGSPFEGHMEETKANFSSGNGTQ